MHDVIVIGGGIVGLATAWRLKQKAPGLDVMLLEKEHEVGQHQTGHNSGVIHSGVYYKPGSLKARLCRRGYEQLLEFASARDIPFELCGKLILACDEKEEEQLKVLEQRGIQNGLKGLKWITQSDIAKYEPEAAGTAALLVPHTGIIDFKKVCQGLKEELNELGVEVALGRHVKAIRNSGEGKAVSVGERYFAARCIIACAGLQSDRIASMDGLNPGCKIIPFLGEYFQLRDEAQGLVKNLIYPVPDPRFPFLGVHFTRMINGTIECGPNAIVAVNREGYNKFSANPADIWDTVTYSGFLKLAKKHWKMGIEEYKRSFSKKVFAESLQRLVPSIVAADLIPVEPGIRAQAVDEEGNTVDDFLFAESSNSLHVLNAPSPAATASLAIGEYIADKYFAKFPG